MRYSVGLHDMGLGFLQDSFSRLLSIHPVRSKRRDVLQVPFAREHHLLGPWKRSFLLWSLSSGTSFPTEVRIALTLQFFHNALKTRFVCQACGPGCVAEPYLDVDDVGWFYRSSCIVIVFFMMSLLYCLFSVSCSKSCLKWVAI